MNFFLRWFRVQRRNVIAPLSLTPPSSPASRDHIGGKLDEICRVQKCLYRIYPDGVTILFFRSELDENDTRVEVPIGVFNGLTLSGSVDKAWKELCE